MRHPDAVQPANTTQMREAFARQLENEDYQRFLAKVPRVEGVWDDHDYGGEKKKEEKKKKKKKEKRALLCRAG